jgi:hypothetical protein
MFKYLYVGLFFGLALSSCGNKKQATAATEKKVIDASTLPSKPPVSSFVSMDAIKEQEEQQELPTRASKVNSEDSLMVRFSRTACFGTCPIFTMSIYTSGKAVYEGKNFVEMKGLFQTEFKITDIKSIFNKAEQISFLTMKDSYDNMGVSDLPSVIVRLNDGVYTKQIIDRYDGPKELQELEKLIDDLILKQNWSKIE